jgi:regulator of replication initiation timing
MKIHVEALKQLVSDQQKHTNNINKENETLSEENEHLLGRLIHLHGNRIFHIDLIK